MNIRLRLITFGLLVACMAGVAQSSVDSVMNIIRSLPQDTVRLHELKQSCELMKDTPEELILLDTLLRDASFQGNIQYQGYAYRNVVRYYFNANDLVNIKIAFEPATVFFRQHKLYSDLFEAESMLIITYTKNGECEFALLRGHKMYKEAVKSGCEDGIVAACYALAYASYISGRDADAVMWSKRGINVLGGQEGKHMSKMELYFMLSEGYYNLEKRDSVLMYVDSVRWQLDDYKKMNPDKPDDYFSYYWRWLYCRYAGESLLQNNLPLAKEQLDKATAYVDAYTFDAYMEMLCYAWSDYYLAAGDYDKALEYLDKGLRSQKEELPGEEPYISKAQAMIYYKKGDYSLAADAIQQSLQISDSINEARFLDQSRQLRAIYEVNRLEAEGEEQASIVRMQLVLVVLLCVFVFTLGFYLYRFWRMKLLSAVAAENAKNANINTSLFLENMSREVKTFLQEISDLSNALIVENDPDRRQKYAAGLNYRNEQAQRVIFDILDVSKIESNLMQFHSETIGVAGLMSEVGSLAQQYKPESVAVNLILGADTSIMADPLRLSKVLISITRYAVTHAGAGSINLGYEVREKEICFFIHGEKWAMSDQEYQSIFDRLVQTSGKLEDMRLEMIISKGLIMKMGGQLFVYPNPVSDTRFEFILPVHPDLKEEKK